MVPCHWASCAKTPLKYTKNALPGARPLVVEPREQVLPAQALLRAEAVERAADQALVLAKHGVVLVVLPSGGGVGGACFLTVLELLDKSDD